jgi:hypothetical protein
MCNEVPGFRDKLKEKLCQQVSSDNNNSETQQPKYKRFKSSNGFPATFTDPLQILHQPESER